MCEPVSIAMGVMGVAGAATSYMGASDEAESQAAYNRQLSIHRRDQYLQAADYQQKLGMWQQDRYYQTAASVQDSARGQYATVLEQVDQVRAQTLNEISKAHQSARQGSSFVRAAASETGTTGNSIAIAQQQYEMAEARFTDLSYENLKNRIRQSERNLAGIQAQSQNMINQAMPAPMAPLDPVQPTQQIESPSMLPYIIQGGSSIIGAAAHSQTIDAIKGPLTGGTAGLPGSGVMGPPAPSWGGTPYLPGMGP